MFWMLEARKPQTQTDEVRPMMPIFWGPPPQTWKGKVLGTLLTTVLCGVPKVPVPISRGQYLKWPSNWRLLHVCGVLTPPALNKSTRYTTSTS